MLVQTISPARAGRNSRIADVFDFQSEPVAPKPVEVVRSSTVFYDRTGLATIVSQRAEKAFLPPLPVKPIEAPVGADASVIQIWEGRVLSVDLQSDVMSVLLSAKIGQVSDHTAEIDLQWVADQDRDLVQPGAVFYLTLFKRLRRGSIENAQELRFRRRPAWSRQQIQRIQTDAAMLRSKMKARPIAE
ncbi:MAG: hypothetical protein NFW16_14575 [Candidatus Accumulibacter sp.]|uniref:hypothetical protein n=1 Tax=Accumulibacter sp. TaxID=2053492 RepID=UPI002582CCBC|nr:hypothetical protein [Accumulibacter sp.]MCM8622918.1 hypothetical protein [Accumulibacter sp.]